MAVRRYRKRYIVFKSESKSEVEKEKVERAVLQSTGKLLGFYGAGRTRLRFLPQFWKKNQGVLSVDHAEVPKIKTALALVTNVGSQKVILYSTKVFGTLKKIKKMYGGKLNGSIT
ncbi:MAG TPA: hypothetical protein ENN30_01855 [Candidatus Woesearchaeota archaeon]|nr:hypothetical protein [Candidatus Woesearchaeota archaeon]